MKPHLPGVEIFLEQNGIPVAGPVAQQIRDWALESLYWNALCALHPMDIVTVVSGAESGTEMQNGLKERLDRRFGFTS